MCGIQRKGEEGRLGQSGGCPGGGVVPMPLELPVGLPARLHSDPASVPRINAHAIASRRCTSHPCGQCSLWLEGAS